MFIMASFFVGRSKDYRRRDAISRQKISFRTYRICGWDLGDGGELMILDPMAKVSRVVHGIIVTDVDYIFDRCSPAKKRRRKNI